jgi:hypothetical protein
MFQERLNSLILLEQALAAIHLNPENINNDFENTTELCYDQLQLFIKFILLFR